MSAFHPACNWCGNSILVTPVIVDRPPASYKCHPQCEAPLRTALLIEASGEYDDDEAEEVTS